MPHRRLDSSKYPPVTEEQLAFFASLERHAVNSAVSRVLKRALVGFLILLGGLIGSIWANSHDASQARHATVVSGRAVSVDGCNRDFMDKDDFRGLLIRLKVANMTAYKASKVKDRQAYEAAQKFYDDALSRQRYPRCGAARSIVTDDPNKTIIVPRPLSPADAKNADVKAAIKRIENGG